MLPCSCHLWGGCPGAGSLCLYFAVISMPPLSLMSKVLLGASHLLPFCECVSSDASALKGLTHLSLLNIGLLSANPVNVSHPPLAMLSQKAGVYLLDSRCSSSPWSLTRVSLQRVWRWRRVFSPALWKGEGLAEVPSISACLSLWQGSDLHMGLLNPRQTSPGRNFGTDCFLGPSEGNDEAPLGCDHRLRGWLSLCQKPSQCPSGLYTEGARQRWVPRRKSHLGAMLLEMSVS